MMRTRAMAFGLIILFGCDKTDECRRLEEMLPKYEEALAVVARRATNAERFQKKADAAEKDAKETLTRLGLRMTEEELEKLIDERSAGIAGAKRSRRVETFAPPEESATNAKTIWTIEFAESNWKKVREHLNKLFEGDVLFRFETIRPSPDGKSWMIELSRAVVDELPIKLDETPSPELPNLDGIKSELGFCGASRLRSEMFDIAAKIESLKEDAGRTTVLLPKAASWKGLQHRAELVERIEKRNRELYNAFLDAVETTKSKLKAIGFSESRMVLEIWGSEKDVVALGAALHSHRRLLAVPESKDKGIVRLTLENVEVPAHERQGGPGH